MHTGISQRPLFFLDSRMLESAGNLGHPVSPSQAESPADNSRLTRTCQCWGLPCSGGRRAGRQSSLLFLPAGQTLTGAKLTRLMLGEEALVPTCALRAAKGPVRGMACADPETTRAPRLWHGTDGQSSEVPGDGYCILVSSSQRPGFCHVQGQTLAFRDCIRGSPSSSAPVLQRIEKKSQTIFLIRIWYQNI